MSTPEQNSADIIVIGGGAAGLSAAIEASKLGRSVILLEKNAELGGTTAWAVGAITATRTPHQRSAGVDDSPDDHFEDLDAVAGKLAPRDNKALRRILVDGSVDVIPWLMSLGLVFLGPMPEPPHRKPRMHNVVPSSRAFPFHLGRECRRLGVDIRLNARAIRLHKDGTRVTGVVTQTAAGREQILSARKAVILAAGDYAASAEWKAALGAAAVADVESVNPTSTGDGFRLGVDAGGSVLNGDIVRGPIMRFVPPRKRNLLQQLPPHKFMARVIVSAVRWMPHALLRPFLTSFITTALGPSPELFAAGAILVNAHGDRFTDERQSPASLVFRQPGGNAYIVLDAKRARMFEHWPNFVSTAPNVAYAYLSDYKRSRADIYREASTVEDLARQLGMKPDTLAASLRTANASDGPFVALGPVRSYVVFTDGGLRISKSMEVLDAASEPIPGLYAAGSNGQGGLLLEGHGHHLGWAFVSGRIAGRNAAT